MLRDNHFRLITLGRLTLVGPTGEEDASLAKQRRKLALLAVFATARRPLSRDALVEMFWGDQDESRARHSLSNALSSLRRTLGTKAITTREAEVALSSDATLSVDALELASLVEGREHGRAAALYGGPFLEGCYVDGSSTFDQWMSRERRRLELLFLQACAQHCAALARGRRWPECHALARRWLDAQPLSSDAAIYLLNAAKAPGTRTALAQAIEEYETLKTHLAREFQLLPEPSVRSLVEGIRDQLATVAPDAPSEPPAIAASPPASAVPPASPDVSPSARETPRSRPTGALRRRPSWNRRLRQTAMGGAAAVSLLAFSSGAGETANDDRDAAVPKKPLIAVLSIDLRTNDSTLAWLSDGLPQMIAGQLAHNAAVDVAPRAQVRAVVARSGQNLPARESFDDVTARDVARRVGATLEARGTLVRDADKLVLELMIHDVASGALVQNVVLTRSDPLALADEATVRILGAANVSAPGAHFTDLETPSLEAYQQYMRAVELGQAGRSTEARRAVDAAVALDSGFIAAVRTRLSLAVGDDDTTLIKHLRGVIGRHADRATEFDRLDAEAEAAFYAGERERSEALARALLRRYPRDPRSYARLEAALGYHAAIDEAERVAIRQLSIDSLAMTAGNGPCAPCTSYFSIVSLRWQRADFRGAADWARRWIRIQPDGAPAWTALAWTYSYMQRPDSALPAMQRAFALSGGDLWARESLTRMLMVLRRYDAADSAIASIDAGPRSIERTESVADLRSILARERGQYRASSRLMKDLAVASPHASGFADIITADNMRLLGNYAEAARRHDAMVHPASLRLILPIPSASARAFCWSHALAADAYASTGDTLWLSAVADTLEAGCSRSFYARDWLLYHHVRGLVAATAHRYAAAEQEFKQATWTLAEGWSRTTVELANTQAALGRPRDAIATLRTAYATRLDAMGRYVPISELDYRMAKLFTQAGEQDSARVYGGYARRAWRDGDPEVRRLVASLP